MNDWLNSLEQRYGRRAIRRLTTVMIVLIAAGYILELAAPNLIDDMTLNVYALFHGQIWRLITWLLVPPSAFSIFTIIMLFFYFSIGSSLERAWGDFRYNVYIFGGIFITIVIALITYAAFVAAGSPAALTGSAIGSSFSTYYICMSILLAYAATFPDAVVLLMFVIPVKMKYFGWVYGAFMAYDAVSYIRMAVSGGNPLYLIPVVAMLASVINFLFYYLFLRPRFRMSKEQRKRQQEFFRQMQAAAGARGRGRTSSGVVDGSARVTSIVPRHRCEVCGRTDLTDPELEFRYCSKCEGAHEYCMEHLYTHTHIHTS